MQNFRAENALPLVGRQLHFLFDDRFVFIRAETVAATANPLDISFGNGGKIIYETGSLSTNTENIAIQPDGKILISGDISYISIGLPNTCLILLNFVKQ